MPRMGYGYSAGPEDMATGNPFYNPMSPTPDWASGIAAFYQNLQQAKDRKRAQQLQDEEMRWQGLQREMEMKAQQMKMAQMEREAQDYIPESQKQAYDLWMEGLKDNLKRKRELEDAEAKRKHEVDIAKIRASSSGGDIEKEGIRDVRAGHKKQMEARRDDTKRLSDARKKMEEIDKYVVLLKYRWSVATAQKNIGYANVLLNEMENKKNEKEILQSEIDTIAGKYAKDIGLEGSEAESSLPAGFKIIK